MGIGITLDERIHTYKDWGLNMISVLIPMPPPKTKIIDIPGGDGSIDLSETNGRPMYNDRSGLQLVFDILDGNYTKWLMKYSKFAAEVHGRKIKMVLDGEPEYYYMVRLGIDGEKTNPVYSKITLSGSAEPFKSDLVSSGEPWIWDIFNFHTGVIRNLMDVIITSTNRTVVVLGGGIDNPPVFIVEEANNLKLIHNGRTYTLKVGRNRFPAVRVGKEDVTLNFSGTGKLTIEYRGRYL